MEIGVELVFIDSTISKQRVTVQPDVTEGQLLERIFRKLPEPDLEDLAQMTLKGNLSWIKDRPYVYQQVSVNSTKEEQQSDFAEFTNPTEEIKPLTEDDIQRAQQELKNWGGVTDKETKNTLQVPDYTPNIVRRT